MHYIKGSCLQKCILVKSTYRNIFFIRRHSQICNGVFSFLLCNVLWKCGELNLRLAKMRNCEKLKWILSIPILHFNPWVMVFIVQLMTQTYKVLSEIRHKTAFNDRRNIRKAQLLQSSSCSQFWLSQERKRLDCLFDFILGTTQSQLRTRKSNLNDWPTAFLELFISLSIICNTSYMLI